MKHYVPLTWLTYQPLEIIEAQPYYECHGRYTEAELNEKDETFQFAEKIAEFIKQIGDRLGKKEIIKGRYDEDGNPIGDAHEEERIIVVGYPGIFVDEELIPNIKQKAYLKNYKNNISPQTIEDIIGGAYYGKYPVRVTICYETFGYDYYSEMAEQEKIDPVEWSIEGVVDISLLSALLRDRGINMDFNAESSEEVMNKEMNHIRAELALLDSRWRGKEWTDEYNNEMRNVIHYKYDPPRIEYPNNDEYLKDLVNSQMETHMRISIPFSKYLKEFKDKESAKQ